MKNLKPYGKAGDPLVGNFEGAWLVQRYRSFAAPDAEIDKILEEFLRAYGSYEKAKEKLIEEYGPEVVNDMQSYVVAESSVYKSWECRDCACLSTKRLHIMENNIYWGKP